MDRRVEAFSGRVVDAMFDVIQDAFLVSAQHTHNFFDWLQLTAHCALSPAVEVIFRWPLVAIIPELYKAFLNCSGARSFQIDLKQSGKFLRF